MTGTRPLPLAIFLLWACGGEEPAGTIEAQVTCSDAFPSAPADLFGVPMEIAVDESGGIYVSDPVSNQVHFFSPAGNHVGSTGRQGQGPGEFDRPGPLSVGDGLVRVVDRGNGRLQTLTTEGEYVHSRPLPPNGDGREVFLGPAGEMLVGTRGAGDALAVSYDAAGDSVGTFGHAVAPFVPIWDFPSMKDRIAAGEIPEEMRNTVLPVASGAGSVYLILSAEGRLQRFGPGGALEWETPIDDARLQGVREDFFTRNREDPRPFALYSLSYVNDGVALGDSLWLLLNTAEGAVPALLTYSPGGSLVRRTELTNAPGARQMAPGPDGSRVYVTVPDQAMVMVCPLV